MGENLQEPGNASYAPPEISPGQKNFGDMEQQLKEKDVKINDLTRENENLKAELEEKECRITELTNENENLKVEVEEKECRINTLTSENGALSTELETYKPRENPATIQLFHIHRGDNIKEIEEELRSAVKLRLNYIDFINRNLHADIINSQKLIVLCIISSRFGTDAENAIQHVKSLSIAALVLIHVKESHALPNRRSRNALTGEKFKDLGGIFDLAYMPRKGIYQCKMNNEELDGITKFITEPLSTTS